MTFCPGVKGQRISAHPADGPHPEEGLGPPLGGDLEHPFDVADLPEGGVDLLGGGKDTLCFEVYFLRYYRKNKDCYLMCKKTVLFFLSMLICASTVKFVCLP